MRNSTIIGLAVRGAYNSPFIANKGVAYNIRNSRFNNFFSNALYGSTPFSLSGVSFKNFVDRAIMFSTETDDYTGVITKHKSFENPVSAINITDCAFININHNLDGGAISITRGDAGSLITAYLTRTKFDHCTTTATASCLYSSGVGLNLDKVCASDCVASSSSFIKADAKDADISITHSFTYRCHATAVNVSKSSIDVSFQNEYIRAVNISQGSRDNDEAAIAVVSPNGGDSSARYIAIRNWYSQKAAKIIVDSDGLTYRNWNFININSTKAVVSLHGSFTLEAFCFQNVNSRLFCIEDEGVATTVRVLNSMVDAEDVDPAFVQVSPAKFDRAMTMNDIQLQYGPNCYVATPPSKDDMAPIFFGIAGVLLLVVLGGIGYAVVFLIKRPRMVEESTAMLNYEMVDRFGEMRITA